MSKLEGKKVLFIGIGFYDYENAIAQEMEQRGASVYHVNSSYNTFWGKVFNKIGLKKLSNFVRRYYKLKSFNQKIDNDIVFLIKGEHLNQEDCDILHTLNPNAKFILYLWDSLVRHDNKEILLKNFDNIWSFDLKDCEQNSQLRFRPLFYRSIPQVQSKKYTLSFIGWVHSDRLEILRSLRQQLQGHNYFMKLYMGPFHYVWMRYFTRIIKKEDSDIIITTPIKYKQFQNITASSEMVLDIAHPLQSGLTMRTIETLAMGCHLLTTNADIVNYRQIPSTSYTVIDRNHVKIPIKNFSRNIPNAEFLKYYSISCFIDQIFA